MRYPNERQIEYWTSRAIEDYFENEGYSVVVLPNSQRIEHWIPFDHLFAISEMVKVFGLQYKRLYPYPEDHWRLDQWQHTRMQNYTWIYYALSGVRSIREHRNALHLLQLTGSCFQYCSSLHPKDLGHDKIPYFRWGGFVQGLYGCQVGWRLQSHEEIREALGIARELSDLLIDLYVVGIQRRGKWLIRTSPFVADVGEADGFDFGDAVESNWE